MASFTQGSLSAADRQRLLHLGESLRRARRAIGLSSAELAGRVGISRTTLQAVESGSPSPAIGTYLRVLSAVDPAGDRASLASGGSSTTPAGQTVGRDLHATQDLQSLLMHEAAVRLLQDDPSLLVQATSTLERWRSRGPSHSMPLWDEWVRILARKDWSKALASTQRARQLRQASPLPTLLPETTRLRILSDIKALRSKSHRSTPEGGSRAAP